MTGPGPAAPAPAYNPGPGASLLVSKHFAIFLKMLNVKHFGSYRKQLAKKLRKKCLAKKTALTSDLLQVVEDGYEFFAKRQLVTLFSAPNYCGEFDNAGAMMTVDETLMCSFQVLFSCFGALFICLGFQELLYEYHVHYGLWA